MLGERESSNDPSLPFKEKEKEGEGRSKAWWPMEGEGEGSFPPFPIFPLNNFIYTFVFFPLTLRFYFTMVLGRYLRIPSIFLGQ
jgi:hypothetical protein